MLLSVSFAFAASLAGVTLPDSVSVAGTPLVLNGMGLREKYFIDIYVGGLYLPHPSQDGAAIIAANQAKRVEMHFVYREVSKEQMIASFQEDFGSQPGYEGAKAYSAQVISWLPEVVKRGDVIAFEYAPEAGLTMLLNGKVLGTVPGSDFAKVVFGIYVGERPPTAALKKGLLGL